MISSKVTVAAVQMISGTCLQTNLTTASKLILKAACAGAQLVVLPESFAIFGVNEIRPYALAEEKTSPPIQTFLAQQAKEHNITLVGGSIPRILGANGKQAEANKCFAAVHIYSPKGLLVGRYDKVHLWEILNKTSKSVIANDNHSHHLSGERT